MPTISQIHDASAEFVAIRRHIHAHPELAFEEFQTAELVAEKLKEWGYEVHRGLARTGVVGTLRVGKNARSLGLRADMDALPINEESLFAHKSQNPGKMHACGHDGHTTMLLAAARYLARTRTFDGTVHLIFQPAEEGGNAGARAMIRDGLFEIFQCDAVFGLHNWPGMASGTFGVRPGTLLASSTDFHVKVIGRGCHAALPHNGADPLVAAAQMISSLQTIISRNKKAVDTAVLSVTQFQGGSASNITPDSVRFSGTIRTFTNEVLDLVEHRLRQMMRSMAEAMDCSAEVELVRAIPPTINSLRETQFAASVMREIVGNDQVNDNVEPTMGGEDFAYMLQERPGCYAFLGNGEGGHRDSGHGLGPCSLHNSSYDFNDEILSTGASYLARLVERWLPTSAGTI